MTAVASGESWKDMVQEGRCMIRAFPKKIASGFQSHESSFKFFIKLISFCRFLQVPLIARKNSKLFSAQT